jgi:hypothetical protein
LRLNALLTIVLDIELDKTRLIDFIESLGRYLTDEDTGIRVKGLLAVSKVHYKWDLIA